MTRYRVELVELIEADSAEQAIAQVSSQPAYTGAVATPLDDTGSISKLRKRNALLRAIGRDALPLIAGAESERAERRSRRADREVRRRRKA